MGERDLGSVDSRDITHSACGAVSVIHGVLSNTDNENNIDDGGNKKVEEDNDNGTGNMIGVVFGDRCHEDSVCVSTDLGSDVARSTAGGATIKVGSLTFQDELPFVLPILGEDITSPLENKTVDMSNFNEQMLSIYNKVFCTKRYNFERARIPIPSGLNIDSWKQYLQGYHDAEILNYLECGWPSGFVHNSPLLSTFDNHQSGLAYSEHIDHYISVETSKWALLGPFSSPPVVPMHLSPIMTRPKKDSLIVEL